MQRTRFARRRCRALARTSGLHLHAFLIAVPSCCASRRELRSAGDDRQVRVIRRQGVASSQIQALVTRDFASIEKLADPGIAGPALHPTLEQMAGLIPPGKPRSVKLVGAHTLKSADQQQANLTYEYEYEYPGKWLLINVATRKTGSGVSIVGFRVQPEDQSLEDQNRFTVSGKTALQYLVLALAVVVPLITLYAFVVCIRTPFAGRKWPWLLFILAGIGSLAVNWTTGEWAVGILRVQLLGASATAPLYGPLTIAVSLPVGALVFLARRQRLR